MFAQHLNAWQYFLHISTVRNTNLVIYNNNLKKKNYFIYDNILCEKVLSISNILQKYLLKYINKIFCFWDNAMFWEQLCAW